MKIDKYQRSEIFCGEPGETLIVQYDNRGDPYVEGITFELNDGDKCVFVFIEKQEAKRIASLIEKLYP